MSPRLNKRQQRQQEELLALGAHRGANVPVDSSDEDDRIARPVVKTDVLTGFAALTRPDESEHDEEDSEPQQLAKAKKPKKKKKRGGASVATSENPQSREGSHTPNKTATQPKKEKKTSKKSKAKDREKSDGDDLDKALAELSVKYPELQNLQSTSHPGGVSSSSNVNASSWHSLLAVSLQHLDSEAEMRRFFGSKVIHAAKAQSKHPRGVGAANQGLKSNLTKPQPTWWSAAHREGLSSRPLSETEISEKQKRGGVVREGEKWWTVEYSKRYRSVTQAFISAVLSGDPEQFWRILNKLPWHADTLLQMSEVYRHQEEYSQSVDFLNRALFTYERSFIGAMTFTSGVNRLDFDQVENRPFYLTIGRMIADLQRRGCVRTAFEFARLLLSLDPHTDPQGALLYLDCLAIKGGMQDWLLDVWALHDSLAEAGDLGDRFNVTALPGWAYARALALRTKEEGRKAPNFDESTRALKEAILAFPSVVPLLADKVDIALPADLRGHKAFRVHVDTTSLSTQSDALLQSDGATYIEAIIHLLSHLYVHRSFSLWKTAENAAWLKAVSISALPDVNPGSQRLRKRFNALFSGFESPSSTSLAYSIYRHVILLDANTARRLTAFFSPSVLSASSLSCDPLPPRTAVTQYDQSFFGDTDDVFAFTPRTRRQREADARVLERMIPNAVFRGHLQAIFDAHPLLQERFPGGVAQFAQVAVEQPEVFDELLLGEDAMDMPGGMPGEDMFGRGVQVFAEFTDDDTDPEPVGEDRLEGREVEGAGLVNEEARGNDGRREENAGHREVGDEGDDGDDEVPTLPVRILRNLVNRFWGGGEASGADHSDPDEDQPLDIEDVD